MADNMSDSLLDAYIIESLRNENDHLKISIETERVAHEQEVGRLRTQQVQALVEKDREIDQLQNELARLQLHISDFARKLDQVALLLGWTDSQLNPAEDSASAQLQTASQNNAENRQ
jgi:predicted  nucleic acid-binding Zn-ribbon protein